MDRQTNQMAKALIVSATFLMIAPRSAGLSPSKDSALLVSLVAAQNDEREDSTRSLNPIPFPNLANMEKVIQDELGDAQSKLVTVLQKSGVTDSELSQA